MSGAKDEERKFDQIGDREITGYRGKAHHVGYYY